MPIYEYVCTGCQGRFERFVRRFGEEVTCPTCASAAVDKQLSVFAALSSPPSPSLATCGSGACGAEGCGAGPDTCRGGACALES
jgi:putative FmdB family regulatory protein